MKVEDDLKRGILSSSEKVHEQKTFKDSEWEFEKKDEAADEEVLLRMPVQDGSGGESQSVNQPATQKVEEQERSEAENPVPSPESSILRFRPDDGEYDPNKNIYIEMAELKTKDAISYDEDDSQHGFVPEGDIALPENESEVAEADEALFQDLPRNWCQIKL